MFADVFGVQSAGNAVQGFGIWGLLWRCPIPLFFVSLGLEFGGLEYWVSGFRVFRECVGAGARVQRSFC